MLRVEHATVLGNILKRKVAASEQLGTKHELQLMSYFMPLYS
tara:strand:+ start:29088 stop:29213 length:126 start_codon:yes stop_codon:yes gene_type:complete